MNLQTLYYGVATLVASGTILYGLYKMVHYFILQSLRLNEIRTNHLPHIQKELSEIRVVLLLIAGHLGLDIRPK